MLGRGVERRRVRGELGRDPGFLIGLLGPSVLPQQQCQVVVGLGVVRPGCDRGPVVVRSLFQATGRVQQRREVVVGFAEFRPRHQCGPVVGLRAEGVPPVDSRSKA